MTQNHHPIAKRAAKESPSLDCSPQTKPHKITTRIAYPWHKGLSDVTEDPRYAFLMNLALTAGGRNFASLIDNKLASRPARLRGKHGSELRNDIFAQIEGTDILLADFTDRNPNVLLEIGYALGCRSLRRSNYPKIFLFYEVPYTFGKAERPQCPSDLSGFLITYYRNIAAPLSAIPTYALVSDRRGFVAAFNGALRDLAKNKPPLLPEQHSQ
jgi:hypothetical protein